MANVLASVFIPLLHHSVFAVRLSGPPRPHNLGREPEPPSIRPPPLPVCPGPTTPALPGIVPSSPGETASHPQITAWSAATWQNNQFWPLPAEVSAHIPANPE